MKRLAAIAATALLSLVLGLDSLPGGPALGAEAPDPRVAEGQGVTFSQVSFTWPEAPTPFSNTGSVDVDIPALLAEKPPMSSGYLNVQTSLGWVVQNLEVFGHSPYGTVSTTFQLKVSPDPEELHELFAYVNFSASPLDSLGQFSGPGFDLFNVGQMEYNADGFGEGVPAGYVPEPPPPNALAFAAGAPKDTNCFQADHTNVQTATNQCVPAAAANSFDWLRAKHGINVPAGHQNVKGLGCPNLKAKEAPDSLVAQFDSEIKRQCEDRFKGQGAPHGADTLGGELCYIKHNNVAGVRVEHQSVASYVTPGGLVKMPGPAGDFNGKVYRVYDNAGKLKDQELLGFDCGVTSHGLKFPDANTILEKVCAGYSVQLIWAVEQGPGHALTVVGAGKTRGNIWIQYISDELQTNHDAKDEKLSNAPGARGKTHIDKSYLRTIAIQGKDPAVKLVQGMGGVGLLGEGSTVIMVIYIGPAGAGGGCDPPDGIDNNGDTVIDEGCPEAVGGTTELLVGGDAPASAAGGGGDAPYAAIAGGVAGLFAMAGGGWFVRRLFRHRRIDDLR